MVPAFTPAIQEMMPTAMTSTPTSTPLSERRRALTETGRSAAAASGRAAVAPDRSSPDIISEAPRSTRPASSNRPAVRCRTKSAVTSGPNTSAAIPCIVR